eukprot:gnl/MRDRNA2_/MRDRNA2_66870_c0_seq1.p1 gnl/MRDRNA2_/MRDRNA2_66870_c0~~gnl/MRDRNA2_/MRDRNA2_66870_c0_seq1.p1  ORF type:complete len:294 (-),score=22.66 gnl/MRDRNA2_/MRDRNA2_66870_c0_seq1:318-1199(-)
MSWSCALCAQQNGRFDLACLTCGRPKGYVPWKSAKRKHHHERAKDDSCVVCYEATPNRFDECGHALCDECQKRLPDSRCPMCRTDVDLGQDENGQEGNEASPNASVPCQRLLMRLRRVSDDRSMSFQEYAKYIIQYSIMLNRLQLMRVVTQDQREAFLSEVRSAVRKRIQQVDLLEQVPHVEAVLAQLCERQIIGEAEIRVLRKHASELLPFRRGVRQDSQPSTPSNDSRSHQQRRSDLLSQHWPGHTPRGPPTASALMLPRLAELASAAFPSRPANNTTPRRLSGALRAQYL